MKKFNELLPGDKIYWAEQNSMKFKEEAVVEVNNDKFITSGYSNNKHNRWADTEKKIEIPGGFYSYPEKRVYFTSLCGIKRYCKAQLMKELFERIANAKRSVESVKELRKEHWELLNHEWTEAQINELEKTLA